MALADRIAIMNQGIVEQIGTPQEVYDQPASMFVADFIGSPPMSFLRFEGTVRRGESSVRIGEATVGGPELREEGTQGPLALGAPPEHAPLAQEGPTPRPSFRPQSPPPPHIPP